MTILPRQASYRADFEAIGHRLLQPVHLSNTKQPQCCTLALLTEERPSEEPSARCDSESKQAQLQTGSQFFPVQNAVATSTARAILIPDSLPPMRYPP
jgi:hypothetical protein